VPLGVAEVGSGVLDVAERAAEAIAVFADGCLEEAREGGRDGEQLLVVVVLELFFCKEEALALVSMELDFMSTQDAVLGRNFWTLATLNVRLLL